ncbi:MAG: hypothetical protein NZ740_06910 [Kiritimatiellae bacterium]|nr:hypothetical protein [Kiritimatiellia bacterium]MDW8458827.1 hypothetical protein [Verrucomicrobiota bacterium]
MSPNRRKPNYPDEESDMYSDFEAEECPVCHQEFRDGVCPINSADCPYLLGEDEEDEFADDDEFADEEPDFEDVEDLDEILDEDEEADRLVEEEEDFSEDFDEDDDSRS